MKFGIYLEFGNSVLEFGNSVLEFTHIWITDLHISSKNEHTYSLEKELFDMGKTVVVLDGKSVRSGLSNELDYSPTDRAEHLRRVAHIAKLLNDQGIIVICSFISPAEAVRRQVAQIIGENRFKLVYMDADIDFCKANDKYNIYKLIGEGKISHVAGIDIEYDVPSNADVIINTENAIQDIDKILGLVV